MGWLPAISYPPAGDGYWSPVTSTINWCEEDYYATIYSAEIVNTLTNLLFVIFALKGLLNCYQNKHDSVFVVTFLGYLVVGMGSFAFHSTLKYPMQLVDELSMIYTTCLTCYASFSYRRSRTYSFIIGFSLLSLAIFITAYYHYLQDPTFHQNAYGILTATVVFRSMYVMIVALRPSQRKKEKQHQQAKAKGLSGEEEVAEQKRQDKRDLAILRQMWIMIAFGLAMFLGGFAIWSLDNAYCSTLRTWRREIGLPWGIILEGHGWWHLMTGTGAYYYIMWGIHLRHCLDGEQDRYELHWPRLFTSLPAVVLKKNKKQQQSTGQNGTLKKEL